MYDNFFLKLKQDEDKDIPIQWFEGNGITPDPFDEPVTVEAEVKADIKQDAYLLRLSSANGTITVTPLIGKIVLHFTAEATKELDFESAYMDIAITETVDDGDTGVSHKTRDLRGTVYLIKKITT